MEVLLNTRYTAELIDKGEISEIKDAMEKSMTPGSQTFEQALYKLFKAGYITKEEAMRNADSASNLSSLVDFAERTNTNLRVPAFDPNQAPKKNAPADFGGIKLNLDENK